LPLFYSPHSQASSYPAHKCYDEFNAWRKQIESKEADEQDMKMLEDVENRIKAK
jgi:hypothetical protein